MSPAVVSIPEGFSNGKPSQVKSEMGQPASLKSKTLVDIIDIRRAAVEINLKDEIFSLLHPKEGPRKLPTLLLYNERGLQLFEEITYLEEYYLTNAEIGLLESTATQIAELIADGSMVIELGSGNLRKVNLLLQAIEKTGKTVDYYALDLSREELERTLAQLPRYEHVNCHGLLGTYDDGREWLKSRSNLERKKCILTLGSSIGNFHRHEASDFLGGFADVLRPGDSMLVGLDACDDPARVYHAYNDRESVTHAFVLNGLVNANDILGEEVFDLADWRVIGEYVYDTEGGRHQAFYSPVRDVEILGSQIKAHERIQIEQSLKFSRDAAQRLWCESGLIETQHWTAKDNYGLHHLVKGEMPFNLISAVYAKSPVPSLEDWQGVWAAWDTVTRGMIEEKELLSKPIDLRNACIFYLGHIPTFLDIQLSKTTGEPLTEPSSYSTIFERGIDPDVDDPEKCHDHSEIPKEWPILSDILEHQSRVRKRVGELYASGPENIPRHVARAVWIGFEHELMHMETLLYMLLQSDKTLAPPHTVKPDFKRLSDLSRDKRVSNEWFNVPAAELTVGLDDPEDSAEVGTYFGWDNEKPSRGVKVASFQAKGRPITNEEYAQYMHSNQIDQVPASWTTSDVAQYSTNGRTNGYVNGYTNGHTNDGSPSLPDSFFRGKSVRTVYGLVPLEYALDWPIFASYDELVGCASWMGGRIPTFEETRSIYSHALSLKEEAIESKLSRKVPAVNGHLSNNGVEETPPSRATVYQDGEVPSAALDNLFIDLDGANVGFHNWHPTPVTAHGSRLCGQGEMGGVWEWTSSVLAKHEGFEPMSLYPGYTEDFFDGKHNIVQGGSWATHPRIAGRKSFVNWYQRNYRYAWVGARLVRDTPLAHN